MQLKTVALATIGISNCLSLGPAFANSFEGIYTGTMDLDPSAFNSPACKSQHPIQVIVAQNRYLLNPAE